MCSDPDRENGRARRGGREENVVFGKLGYFVIALHHDQVIIFFPKYII